MSVIGAKHNETDIFPLAASVGWLPRIDAVELFRSDDDGATWQGPQRVTGRNEINGHLTRLADGRLLLSYGCRVKDRYGVLAKLSSGRRQNLGTADSPREEPRERLRVSEQRPTGRWSDRHGLLRQWASRITMLSHGHGRLGSPARFETAAK